MDRKEFLKSTFAFCGLAMIPAALMESCSQSGGVAPSNVNFTLDLTQSANAVLNNVGGSLATNGVIVVRYSTSVFYAFSQYCTHQGCQLSYDGSAKVFACPCHGGIFSGTTGAVLSGPPPSALTKYNVTQSGNILTVKS